MPIELKGGPGLRPPITPIHDAQYDLEVFPATCTGAVMDILVPTHGKLALTMECVQSIFNFTQAPFHLIILNAPPSDDYGLTEQYIRALQERHPNITYCRRNHPDWKCGNTFFNVGLKYSKADITVTCMNSVTVEPAWETVALELMAKDPQIGGIGFKCLFPNGLIESAGIVFAGHMPTDYGRDQPGWRLSEIRDAECIQWAFSMFRRKALEGNLDENIFHGHVGWDDIDNSFVLKSKGWKLVYCGQGVGIHKPRATRGSNSDEAARLNQDNARTFFKRWGLWNQYIEGSKMNIGDVLKYETKARLSEGVGRIQVLRQLLNEAEKALQPLVNEALRELKVEPDRYLLEMNPATNTWLLKVNPHYASPPPGGAPLVAASDTQPGTLENTAEQVKV